MSLHTLSNGFGLLGSDGPEDNKHCRVDGNSIIQQGSDNFLDQGDGFVGGQGGDVAVGSILYRGAIGWTIPLVRRILGALGDEVLELMEDLI